MYLLDNKTSCKNLTLQLKSFDSSTVLQSNCFLGSNYILSSTLNNYGPKGQFFYKELCRETLTLQLQMLELLDQQNQSQHLQCHGSNPACKHSLSWQISS